MKEGKIIVSAAMKFNEDKSQMDVAQFVEDMNYITQMLMNSMETAMGRLEETPDGE